MDEQTGSNVREVTLDGGPPWGIRIGAVTQVTLDSEDEGGGGEEGSHPQVVGAVKIARVNPETKAANAGLRDGDLILSVNGEAVKKLQETSSQSPSSSTQAEQVRVMGQLQGDRVRLSVLSKKSAKKLQKALAKGEFEQMENSKLEEVSASTGSRKGAPLSSVRWADENVEPMHMKPMSKDNDVEKIEQPQQSQSISPDLLNESSSDNERMSEGRQVEQESPHIPNGDPHNSSSNLLADIIDELQLVANTTAQFFTDMDKILEEGVKEMQAQKQEDQGLLRIAPVSPQTSGAPPVLPKPNKFFPSTLLIKQEDLNQIKKDTDVEPIPPVWSPPGVPPSPKLSKKFRPVNFNTGSVPSSPTNSQNGFANNYTPESPGVLSPPSEPSLSASTSLDLSKHSNSQSSASGTRSSNLPKYQSPTVVLLQKAREGQLPKGASYLQQQQQTHNANSRISNVIHTNDTVGIFSIANHRPSNGPSKPSSANDITQVPSESRANFAGEKEQHEWYRKMYESLHVEKQYSPVAKCTYPAGRIPAGPPARSFWAKRIHSNGTVSEPEDFEHPDEEEYDFNKFGRKTVRTVPPGAIRFNNPGRIEDYNPSGASTSFTKRERYYRQQQPDLKRHWALASPKSSGYESDTYYVVKKRTASNSASTVKSPEPPPLSPAEQKHLYAGIQKGEAEIPLEGLRKFVPGPGPRDPCFEDYGDGRTVSPSQNLKYQESSVNIHYKMPVRLEEKEYVPEEELRRRQQAAMKRFYEEQRRVKFMRELADMERRRHSDHFVPSQKSPIPLNRYDEEDILDGLIDNTPRPGSGGLWQRMTPEPVTLTPTKATGPHTALARAKFNFTAQSPRELQLNKGDLIIIRRKIDANWYEAGKHAVKGTYFHPTGSSATGIVPCTYVEILPDDPSNPTVLAKYTSQPSSKPQDHEGLAKALYNFRPTHSFELELVKGELIVLTRRHDDNWFEGRKQKHPSLSGLFPVSYCTVIKDLNGQGQGPSNRKPIGQPVAHSLSFAPSSSDFSPSKHHYKPNDFVLQSDSDYGELSSPLLTRGYGKRSSGRKNADPRLELITVDTSLNTNQSPRYRAVYDYRPVHSDELELKEGDIVEVLEKCDDGWFVGTSLRTGHFGTFPGNYVTRI